MKKSVSSVLLIITGVFIVATSLGFCEGKNGTIPFRMVGHLMTVLVKINDFPKEFNFVVDTGGATFVDKGVADELGLKQEGPQAKINTLHLPGFPIENVFCFTTFDFSHLKAVGAPVHGIIGSTLLERFKVILDYRTGTINLSEDTEGLDRPEKGILLKFRNHPVNNAPLVEMEINGKTMEAMIDTGQPNPLVLPIETFEEYGAEDFNGCFKSEGLMERWPNTKVDYNYLARVKQVRIGGSTFPNVLCLFGDLPKVLSMPLVGSDFLSQFIIVINFPTDEMLIIPNEDFYLNDNLFSIGMNLDVSEKGEIVVEGIWEKSPAEKAGIKVGDRIVSFNSKKAGLGNVLEFQEVLMDDTIKIINIEVVDAGKIRSVVLEKTWLF